MHGFESRTRCDLKGVRGVAGVQDGPAAARTGLDGLLWATRTLSEIEAAVDSLSPSDQESLLEHLALKLGRRQPVAAQSREKREGWLRKLDQLRARGSAGKTGVALQQILDDIRSELR